jgi:hypothetical protein
MMSNRSVEQEDLSMLFSHYFCTFLSFLLELLHRQAQGLLPHIPHQHHELFPSKSRGSTTTDILTQKEKNNRHKMKKQALTYGTTKQEVKDKLMRKMDEGLTKDEWDFLARILEQEKEENEQLRNLEAEENKQLREEAERDKVRDGLESAHNTTVIGWLATGPGVDMSAVDYISNKENHKAPANPRRKSPSPKKQPNMKRPAAKKKALSQKKAPAPVVPLMEDSEKLASVGNL